MLILCEGGGSVVQRKAAVICQAKLSGPDPSMWADAGSRHQCIATVTLRCLATSARFIQTDLPGAGLAHPGAQVRRNAALRGRRAPRTHEHWEQTHDATTRRVRHQESSH
jgi:hypothetical protein